MVVFFWRSDLAEFRFPECPRLFVSVFWVNYLRLNHRFVLRKQITLLQDSSSFHLSRVQ
jgi:hypothetical protein